MGIEESRGKVNVNHRGAKGARPVRATSGQRGDHTGGKGVACSAPTDPHGRITLRSYENRSVEKEFRVGVAFVPNTDLHSLVGV